MATMSSNISSPAHSRALAQEPVRPGPSPLTWNSFAASIQDTVQAQDWFQYLQDMEAYKVTVRGHYDQYEQRIASLLEEGRGVQATLEDSQATLQETETTLQDTQKALHEEAIKGATFKSLLDESYQKRLNTDSPSTIYKSTKLPDPAEFDGTRSELESFLVQLQLKLAANNDHYSNTNARLAYAITRLKSVALSQVMPKVKNGKIDFESLEAFYSFLRKAFGDPDRKATAIRELFALKQANREFAVFIAEFTRLSAESELGEDALIFALQQAISAELRELMLHHEVPVALQHYIDLLQSLDSRMRASQAINKKSGLRYVPTQSLPSGSISSTISRRNVLPTNTVSSVSSYQAPSIILTPSDSASNLGPMPMDLSAARGPTSPEERNRRRSLGLCLYCGQAGHNAGTCPRLKCYNCQEQGHIAKNCTKPRRQRIHGLIVEEEKTEEQGKE